MNSFCNTVFFIVMQIKLVVVVVVDYLTEKVSERATEKLRIHILKFFKTNGNSKIG